MHPGADQMHPTRHVGCIWYHYQRDISRRRKLYIACDDFFMPCIKSHLALITLLLLSKSDPLCWAPILFFKYVMNTRNRKGTSERMSLFLLPRLRRGFIRCAQIDGRRRCAPSQALSKGFFAGWDPVPHLVGVHSARLVKRQVRKRLPFPHLCSVAPPFKIGPAALSSDFVFFQVRYKHSYQKTGCPPCGAACFFFPNAGAKLPSRA
jgi:hypothetical protein